MNFALFSVISKLVVNIQYYLTQILVDVSTLSVESCCNVFEGFEEAVQVHLCVLAPAHHILVDYIVVSLRDVVIRHVCKLSQPLELARRDEVIILLPSQELKDCLCLRVEVKLLIIPLWIRQNQLKTAHIRWSCIDLLLCVL